MTERQTTRKPRAAGAEAQEAEAERQRQQALKDEKIARATAPVTPADRSEDNPAVEGDPDHAKAEEAAPAPPPKKRAPKADAKPKAEKVAAATEAPNTPAEDLAAEKAVIADRFKGLTAESPASERHEAVKVLAKTGKFSYVEIAKITHYANGGVVRNIVIPPVRKGRPDPLEGEALVAVRALETALGMTVQEIAKRTPKVEA